MKIISKCSSSCLLNIRNKPTVIISSKINVLIKLTSKILLTTNTSDHNKSHESKVKYSMHECSVFLMALSFELPPA